MADMTPGELAAALMRVGEAALAAVKESGLLKPKRRKPRAKRKARKAKPEVAAASNGAARPKKAKAPKPAPAPAVEAAYDPDED